MKRIKLTPEEKAARLEQRRAARAEEKEAGRILAEKNLPEVRSITISIEWRKSRTWGSNPYATAEVRFKALEGGCFRRFDGFTCSGCGYEKTSTVIADIFNRFLIYKLWRKTVEECKRQDYDWEKKGGAPYGISANEKYRSFAGGIGAECYDAISKFIGGGMGTGCKR